MGKRNKRSRAATLRHQRARMALLHRSQQVGALQSCHVRASHSQSDERYPLESRDYQSSCMSMTFLAYENEGCVFTTTALDRVLEQGNSLYAEVKHQLILEKRVRFDHLTLEEMSDQVLTDTNVYNVCIPVVRCGLLKPQAPNDGGQQWHMSLVQQLKCLSREVRHALLIVDPECFALFHDKSGRYGLFDPHPRNAEGLPDHDGTAIMQTFCEVRDLAEHLFKLFDDRPRCATFQFVPILFEKVCCNDHIEQPSAENGSSTVSRDMYKFITKLDKTRRRKILRRMKSQAAKQQTATQQEQPTFVERQKRKFDSEDTGMEKREAERTKCAHKTDPARLLRQRQYMAQKYRTDPEFRNRRKQYIVERYRTDPEFRNRRKQYIVERYRTDPEFRNRRKQYIVERYRTDPEFRNRRKQYMAERYRAQKLLLSPNLSMTHFPIVGKEQNMHLTTRCTGSYLKRYHNDPEFRLRRLQRRSKHSRTKLATNAIFNIQNKVQTALKIKRKYRQVVTNRSRHPQALMAPCEGSSQ